MPQFASEGFDLDNIKNETDVLELDGGKPTVGSNNNDESNTSASDNAEIKGDSEQIDALVEAEEYKRQGNAAFTKKDWSQAYALYSDAIQATPGLSGQDLWQLQKDWQDDQNRKLREALRLRDNVVASAPSSSAVPAASKDSNEERNSNEESTDDSDTLRKEILAEKFVAPTQVHGKTLAVYYSNRAAASMQMALEDIKKPQQQSSPAAASSSRRSYLDKDDTSNKTNDPRLDEAVRDCSIALLLQPSYAKALIRRSTAHERLQNTEAALKDAMDALVLDPSNKIVRSTVQRLKKLEDARMEELKTETMAKLKDLGNSILGNFGLSLDSFNAQKDPATGSYNISFNQK